MTRIALGLTLIPAGLGLVALAVSRLVENRPGYSLMFYGVVLLLLGAGNLLRVVRPPVFGALGRNPFVVVSLIWLGAGCWLIGLSIANLAGAFQASKLWAVPGLLGGTLSLVMGLAG